MLHAKQEVAPKSCATRPRKRQKTTRLTALRASDWRSPARLGPPSIVSSLRQRERARGSSLLACARGLQENKYARPRVQLVPNSIEVSRSDFSHLTRAICLLVELHSATRRLVGHFWGPAKRDQSTRSLRSRSRSRSRRLAYRQPIREWAPVECSASRQPRAVESVASKLHTSAGTVQPKQTKANATQTYRDI